MIFFNLSKIRRLTELEQLKTKVNEISDIRDMIVETARSGHSQMFYNLEISKNARDYFIRLGFKITKSAPNYEDSFIISWE